MYGLIKLTCQWVSQRILSLWGFLPQHLIFSGGNEGEWLCGFQTQTPQILVICSGTGQHTPLHWAHFVFGSTETCQTPRASPSAPGGAQAAAVRSGGKAKVNPQPNPSGTTFFSSLLVFNKPRFLVRLVWKEGSIIKKYFKAISLPHLLMSPYTQVQCGTQWRTWSGKVCFLFCFLDQSQDTWFVSTYGKEKKN